MQESEGVALIMKKKSTIHDRKYELVSTRSRVFKLFQAAKPVYYYFLGTPD